MNDTEKKSALLSTSVLIMLLCVFGILGIYTFINAKGTSYLSSDSSACNNCHIMNEVYHDYTNSLHARMVNGKPLATCSDCHLPSDFIPKWIAKAQSGVGHAYHFTFSLDSLPTHLSATEKTKQMVQNNCVRCHIDTVGVAVNPTTIPGHLSSERSCASCHRNVGH